MNFEDAYKKVQGGAATEEEIAFVAHELDKLRRINEILEQPLVSPVMQETDRQTIEKAKKRHNCKTTLRIILVTLISLMVIAALVCGIIFIPSLTSASRNQKLGREECLELAKTFLSDYSGENTAKYVIKDIDKELRIPAGLTNAIYVYEIEMISPEGICYEMEVSTKSGYVVLTDIDVH